MNLVAVYWDVRLANWALWEVRVAHCMVSVFDRYWWETPPRAPPPLVGEALDTDRMLVRLHGLDREGVAQYHAIRIRYVWTGPEALKAAQARIAERTLRARVLT